MKKWSEDSILGNTNFLIWVVIIGTCISILTRFLFPADAYDPLWLRGIIAGAIVTAFSSLIVFPNLKKHFFLLLNGTFTFATLWMLFMLNRNEFHILYQVQYFLFLFTAAIIFTKLKPLIGFILVNILFSAVAVWATDLDLETTLFFLGISFYIQLSSAIVTGFRIRKKEGLESQSDIDRIITKASFDSSSAGIMVVNEGGFVLRYNQVFLDMWDLNPESLSPDRPRVGTEIALLRLENPEGLGQPATPEPGKVLRSEYELLRFKDGKIVEQYSRPLFLNGILNGRLWYFRDITQQQRDEQVLKENLALLKAVFEKSGVGILVMNDVKGVLDYNQEYLDIFNLTRKFLAENNPPEIVKYCQDQIVNVEESIRDIERLKESPEEECYILIEFKDGRIVERFTRFLKGEGEASGRVWFFRDLTEQYKAEMAKRESERKNKAILDAIPDIMYTMDRAGKYLDFKVKDEEELILPVAEIVDRNIVEILPTEIAEKIIDFTNQALDTGGIQVFEYELEKKSERHIFEVRMVPFVGDQVLIIERDITERKRSEQELVQRNFELDSFVYRASHDLKAPLNSLMGLIELTKDKTKNQEVLAYISMMDRSVVKLDTFIRNLTDFSRINRLTLSQKEINFQDMLQESFTALDYMQHFGEVDKQIEIQQNTPFYSDPFHLGIVLSNLISNAIKYLDTNKGNPFVKIEVEVTEEATTVRISDNGVGIAKEYQGRIFDLFFRASHQSFGSGLGLYITRNAVHKMQGDISLHSEVGKGTVFVVVIPNPGPAVPALENEPGKHIDF